MITDILWVLFYRLKCFKATIDTAFYQLITLKLILCADNICRIFLWIFLILILTPLELLIGISITICESLNIYETFTKKIKMVMSMNGKKKEASIEEYKDYKKFLLEEEKKK